MLMPFFEDGNIDYKSLDQLVEYYLSTGAGGLFANCLSSEMFHLSKGEMLESVSFIVNKVAGRVPVVATGTFNESIPDQANFVKEIYSTGVQSVIIITSLLAKESDSEELFRSNVHELLEATKGIPLGFYECPIPYKRIVQSDFLGDLVDMGRVKYHKDTSLDIQSIRDKIASTHSIASFGLYDAYMVHAVDSLYSGSAGLSCIQGNYFPELIVWLCNNFDAPNLKDEVDLVQEFFINNMNLMHDTYPISAKYVLGKRGLSLGLYSRNRIDKLDMRTKSDLDNLLKDYELLCMKIGISY